VDDDPNRIWKSLGDTTHRRILDLLAERPFTSTGVAEHFPMSRIAVHQHLSLLEGSGLVASEKRGRQRWHYINFAPFHDVYERWLQPYAGRWAASLSAIRGVAEGTMTSGEQLPAALPLAVDIAQEVTVKAPVSRVFGALAKDAGAWWACDT
jgi:DNA-binding transcriptional ArsR family regulator